jgi:hypothetical protein
MRVSSFLQAFGLLLLAYSKPFRYCCFVLITNIELPTVEFGETVFHLIIRVLIVQQPKRACHHAS